MYLRLGGGESKRERRGSTIASLRHFVIKIGESAQYGGLCHSVCIGCVLIQYISDIVTITFFMTMARERPEGVFVESKAVCPCTVCLLHSLGTSFKFADLAPH